MDPTTLLLGLFLGVLLTFGSGLVWIGWKRREGEFLTLDEVRQQIDAETEQRIEEWRERRETTERLTGKGVA